MMLCALIYIVGCFICHKWTENTDSYVESMYSSWCLVMQVDTGSSILSDLTKRELSKKVGHFGFNIHYTTSEGEIF